MFRVNFANGTAKNERITEKGNVVVNNYLIMLDNLGAYVLTRTSKVYLNDKNTIVEE